ncbi:MAG TPA: cache domain-containing protein [Rhodocyclaceae bacterium]|nr:cache domain-containing protein [Rhodocyclaceae bacterium]
MVDSLRTISLKTRVLVLVSLLIIIGIWGLAAGTATVLQADLEKMVAQQLSGTLDYVSADLDHEIGSRINALNRLAAELKPALPADPARLQRLLEQGSLSGLPFSIGVLCADRRGMVVAGVPPQREGVGTSIGAQSYFREVMAGAAHAVGRPASGRSARGPVLTVAVPLKDAAGNTAGVLVGTSPASDQDLFGQLEQTKIGKTGYLIVASPRDKLIISSSDHSRILTAMPQKGVNPLLDRRLDEGFEGPGISVNSRGVEVLTLSRHMKSTDWMVVAGIATSEAFAPITALKRQVYLGALLISLAVAVILYLVLRWQLAPLGMAAAAMRRMGGGDAPLAPIAVARHDEIGELVSNFNTLVAERQQLFDALSASELKYRALVENIPDLIIRIGADNRCLYVSPSCRHYSRHPPEHYLGKTLAELRFPEQSSRFWSDLLADVFTSGQTCNCDMEIDTLIGIRVFNWQVYPELDDSGRVISAVAVSRDITERKRAEQRIRELNLDLERRVAARTDELLVANQSLEAEIGERKLVESSALDFAARLQVMTRRYTGAQEAEKRRLARELHDRVSSSLTAVGLNLGLIARQLPPDAAEKVKERLSDTLALLKDTMMNAREISHDLHPSVLDYGGIVPALEDYGRKFFDHTGIAVQVSGDDPEIRLPAEMEIALYRIAQEALTNCAKHANANKVTISLNGDAERTSFAISDDGSGFDLNMLARGRKTHGLGLLSMRERAEAIGGRLKLESAPGKGTRIHIEI